MKKLLSICFLSIFLMMFSAQAQVPDCCISLSNPAGDTLHNIDNLPNGDLPLSHTMSVPGYGRVDTYDLLFSDANCGIDLATGRVSVELELWCDNQNILDGQHDLSRYCDITLKTLYNELQWVGSPMVGTNYPDVFEYPGAGKIFTGTYNISNVNFDYFFFNFLVNSQTKIIITWHQVFANVQLIVHLRERLGGTNHEFYWNDQQNLNLGGHQSTRGDIIGSDTLSTAKYLEKDSTVISCTPVPVGDPEFIMDHTDTFNIAYVDTTCGYRIDSIITYAFELVEHPTKPTLSDSNYTYCQDVTADPIVLDPEPNSNLASHDIRAEWSDTDADDASFSEATQIIPPTNFTSDTTLIYYVRRHDLETGCYSEVDTFEVKVYRLPDDPSVPLTDTLVEYCVNETAIALAYSVPATQRVLWGTSVDNITDTVAPTPVTTAAGMTIYYLKIQNIATSCVSAGYDSIKVKVYDNPTLAIIIDHSTLCFGDTANLKADPTTLTLSTYQWQKDGVNVTGDTAIIYVNDVTDTTTIRFTLTAAQQYVTKSCSATANDSILAYPNIGTPVAIHGDTAVCAGKPVTLEVSNGAFASISKWYKKDKTTELGTGTTLTYTFAETDTVYVASFNDFGCKTPENNWLRIVVTVNNNPQITLTADNNGEVCAESDLTIHSTVTSGVAPITYTWSGTGLQSPLSEDSVIFNYDTAGVYIETLIVFDNNNCSDTSTINITVFALPVITRDIDYTVANNDYCVGANGKIVFLTHYERYSIDSIPSWQTDSVFSSLAAGNYFLRVEDSHGCVNHVNPETIIDAPVPPVFSVADSANTRCEAPYNGKLIATVTNYNSATTYNYRLDEGAFKADSIFTGLKDSTYKVTVKDMTTGCMDSVSFTVSDGKVTPAVTLAQNPNTHCHAPFGGSVAVTGVTPDADYQYRLMKAVGDTTAYQTDTLFENLNGNITYTVFAQDINTACIGSSSILVEDTTTRPTAVFVGLDYKCFYDTLSVFTVQIDSENVVFRHWDYYGPSASLVTFQNEQSFVMKGFPAATHYFTANIEDTITHCTNEIRDSVRVVSVNLALHVTPPVTCSYDTVTAYCEYFPINPGDDYIVDYSWWNYMPIIPIPGCEDTVKATPSVTGNYISLVATDNHGCYNTFGVFAHVNARPELNIGITDVNYCAGTTSHVTAAISGSTAQPYTYEWKRGSVVESTTDTLAIAVGTTSFDVNLHVADTNGCDVDSLIHINVIQNPGMPIFNPDTQYFCAAADITINPATISQATPAQGDLTWTAGNPNDVKLPDTYSAIYVYTENTVSCYSDTGKLVVVETGEPHFTVVMNYNGSPATSTERCYDTTTLLTEELSITVTPAASAERTYTYQLNSNTPVSTSTFNIHRNEPGTYNDTVKIEATATYGVAPYTATCTWDTTVIFTLKIDSLPTAPDNFPRAYNGGADSVIFYCEGSTADYNFNFDPAFTYSYSPGGSVKPTTEGTYFLVVENNITHCVDSFKYKIVKVPAVDFTVTQSAGINNCGSASIIDTIITEITTTGIDDYTKFFVYSSPVQTITPDSVAKAINIDTLIYTFSMNDTMVTVKAGIYAANGDYTATCYSTPADTIMKVLFQEEPSIPQLDSLYTYFKDSSTVAYCASEYGTFTLTAANFKPITGATISIVGHPTGVDTAGTYKVVANNTTPPGCPSDTLVLEVREKRTPKEPTNLGTGMYDHHVYFCAGGTPVYEFTKENTTFDEFLYSDGGAFVSTKPDTAGTFTLRVRDTKDSCFADFTFDIIEVANPNWDVTVGWADTNICQTDSIYVMSYTPTITAATGYTPTTGVTHNETFVWDGVNGTLSHSYNFGVGADTNLTFAYNEYDTIGNTGYGVACPFVGYKDTITLKYFPTPDVPVYNGLTEFCYGDSIVVGIDSFSITHPATDTLYSTITLPVTYNTTGSHTFDVYAQYKDFGACHSTTNSIVITGYDLPDISINKTKNDICFEGDTSVFTASSSVTGTILIWGANDTTVTNVTDTLSHTVVATDPHGCVKDSSAKVSYLPVFTVTLSKDTTVCIGDNVTLSATVTGTTGDFNLTWYKDSVVVDSIKFSSPITVASGVTDSHVVIPDSSAIVNGSPVPNRWMIEVVDAQGCKSFAESNVISVGATNRPGFIFHTIGGSENIHHMEVHSGVQSGFEMIISQNCGNQAERVFVDVQIYKDGVALSNDELGAAMDFIVSSYNTSYEFDVNSENAPALASVGIKSCYFSGSSYFFPNSEFINFNSYNYDWVYMHFLDKRKITVRTGAWKPTSKGVYTFTFAVVKAGPHPQEVGQLYKGALRVGGYNGHVDLTVKDTVAFDSFSIYVDTVYVGASTENVDNGAIVTPAPEEDVVEAKAINMNVYPNPAHNNVNIVLDGIQGQTVITVHDMSGKAVSSMRVDVENNGQVINLPVDNYSQGIYFIKAVNGSAVMTKKLIIAR